MLFFELLQLMRVFLDYLCIEYLWHMPIMPPTNRNGIIYLVESLPQGTVGAHGCAVPCWVASSLLVSKRSGRVVGVSSLNLVRLGTLGALLAGVAWTVLGLVNMATIGGRSSEALSSAFLDETLYLVALVGTLGGVVGLHARQTPSYGRLGSAGFLAAFTGTAILLVGLILSFLAGGVFGTTFLDPVLGAGLWCVLVGFVLLGAATLRLKALPQWCGVPLIVCLPLAIILGDYGGGIVLGVTWLAVGCALLSQHDVSALLRTGRRKS
jgi:hypothetical protein